MQQQYYVQKKSNPQKKLVLLFLVYETCITEEGELAEEEEDDRETTAGSRWTGHVQSAGLRVALPGDTAVRHVEVGRALELGQPYLLQCVACVCVPTAEPPPWGCPLIG